MGLQEIVKSHRRAWTDAEERVLSVLLSDHDGGDRTVGQIAEAAGTHESTVVRLAQRLGYDGYAHLRRDLRRQTSAPRVGAPPAARNAEPAAALPAADIAVLQTLDRFVPNTVFLQAASAVHRSSEVYLFAKNDELPIRDLLAQRLQRLGKTTHLLESSAKALAERLCTLDERAVLIAFSLRKPSRYLPDVVAEVARRGGASVLITDGAGTSFSPTPDHVLALPHSDKSSDSSDLAPMAIAFALHRAVRQLDPNAYAETEARIDELTRVLGGALDHLTRGEQ